MPCMCHPLPRDIWADGAGNIKRAGSVESWWSFCQLCSFPQRIYDARREGLLTLNLTRLGCGWSQLRPSCLVRSWPWSPWSPSHSRGNCHTGESRKGGINFSFLWVSLSDFSYHKFHKTGEKATSQIMHPNLGLRKDRHQIILYFA